MIASSLIVKTSAVDDIRNIADYIAFDSPTSADRFRVELKAAVERIRSFPETGHKARSPHEKYRATRVSSRFRRYLIFYRVAEDMSVAVVRVLHSAMDIQAELAKSD